MTTRALRELLILLAVALIPALVSGAIQLKWKKDEPLAPGEVRADTARMWGEKVMWVDARPRARYDAGHIGGAVLLNEDEWDALVPHFLDDWEPEKAVVVYCDGGGCEASHSVAERLKRELQIPIVYVLKGGYPAWQSR
ncbi:rhodanese-like domain-containing protein [Verrucomicrobiota bacterium sgz303538]